jgi:hypothetical protein
MAKKQPLRGTRVIKTGTFSVPHKLTDTELVERAMQLAKAEGELREQEKHESSVIRTSPRSRLACRRSSPGSPR